MTANRFLEHPNSVGESYGEHQRAAFGYSWRLFKGSVCCALHGLMPWVCTSSGSQLVRELHSELEARNAGTDSAPDDAPVPASSRSPSALT